MLDVPSNCSPITVNHTLGVVPTLTKTTSQQRWLFCDLSRMCSNPSPSASSSNPCSCQPTVDIWILEAFTQSLTELYRTGLSHYTCWNVALTLTIHFLARELYCCIIKTHRFHCTAWIAQIGSFTDRHAGSLFYLMTSAAQKSVLSSIKTQSSFS